MAIMKRLYSYGTDNDDPKGANLSKARADALAADIIINGLPIGSQSLAYYYENNVIGGEDSLIVRAGDLEHFGEALQKRLVKEITAPSKGAPEPGTMLLMVSAIGALGAARPRRRRNGQPVRRNRDLCGPTDPIPPKGPLTIGPVSVKGHGACSLDVPKPRT